MAEQKNESESATTTVSRTATETSAPIEAAGVVPALLRRKIARRIARAGAGEVSPRAGQLVDQAGASSGSSLPGDVQQKFGASLGTDLSGVRVHTGEASAAAAEAVGARAYTTGQDIHFARGEYDPTSKGGQHLLAHEVAHTAQTGGGVQTKLEVSMPGDAAEVEADAVADRLVEGRSATVTAGGGGLHRKDDDKEDPILDPMIRGEHVNDGKGTDLGYTFVFHNSAVDEAYKQLCTHWSVPLFPDIGGGGGGGGKDKADEKAPPEKTPPKKQGDSEGKDVSSLPAWFNAMQNKLIASSKWGKPEKATQALLEAFLRANYPGAVAQVMSFFHHVGKSETNKASNEFVAGSVGGSNWCAQASSTALTDSLKAHGLRFKGRPAPRKIPKYIDNIETEAGNPVSASRQGALYWLWLEEKNVQGPARKIDTSGAQTAVMEPGDIFSLVTQATPPSGHVATVVKFQDPVITMISGNAGGESVRIEDVTREPMPAGARWEQAQGAKKEPGKTNPTKSGVCWVVGVQKTSQLDANVLEKLDDAALAKMGIERASVSA